MPSAYSDEMVHGLTYLSPGEQERRKQQKINDNYESLLVSHGATIATLTTRIANLETFAKWLAISGFIMFASLIAMIVILSAEVL